MNKASDFKVGDRVRILFPLGVGPENKQLKVGGLGTVMAVQGGVFPIIVDPDERGKSCPFNPGELEVVVTPTLTDFLGKPISVGDTVVYPGRSGSSLWMNKATVLEVRQDKLKVRMEKTDYTGKKTGTRDTVISKLSNVVVVK